MRIERDHNDRDFYHVLSCYDSAGRKKMFSLLGTLHCDSLEFFFGKELEKDLLKLDEGKNMDIDELDLRLDR